MDENFSLAAKWLIGMQIKGSLRTHSTETESTGGLVLVGVTTVTPGGGHRFPTAQVADSGPDSLPREANPESTHQLTACATRDHLMVQADLPHKPDRRTCSAKLKSVL